MHFRSYIAAGWLLVVCAPARAQTSVEPFLTVGADGRYDDYIPGGGDGYVARIAPGAGVRLHTPRLVLRLDGLAAYDRYEGTAVPVPDSWNVHSNLVVDHQATRRWALHVDDHFADVRDPREIDRLGVVTPPGVEILDNASEAKAIFAALRGLWLDAGYAFRTTRFGDLEGPMGPVRVPGGDEHTGLAGISKQLAKTDIIRLDFRGRYFAVGPGAQAHEPALGYWKKLTHTLTVDAEAGPVVFDDTRGPQTTWHARGSLIDDWPHLRLLASYDRDLVGGTGATAFIDPMNLSAGVIWAEFVDASVRWRPVRAFDVTVRGDYFRNGLAPDSVVLVDGYDIIGELVWRLSRTFELAGYYQFRQQFDQTAPGGLGFRHDVAGIRLSALWAPTSRMEKEASEP